MHSFHFCRWGRTTGSVRVVVLVVQNVCVGVVCLVQQLVLPASTSFSLFSGCLYQDNIATIVLSKKVQASRNPDKLFLSTNNAQSLVFFFVSEGEQHARLHVDRSDCWREYGWWSCLLLTRVHYRARSQVPVPDTYDPTSSWLPGTSGHICLLGPDAAVLVAIPSFKTSAGTRHVRVTRLNFFKKLACPSDASSRMCHAVEVWPTMCAYEVPR